MRVVLMGAFVISVTRTERLTGLLCVCNRLGEIVGTTRERRATLYVCAKVSIPHIAYMLDDRMLFT